MAISHRSTSTDHASALGHPRAGRPHRNQAVRCGVAQCGACTVHPNGLPVRSCSVPVSAAGGAKITTIEGLAWQDHKVQKAWLENDVPQCGYCQSGMIAWRSRRPQDQLLPTDADIDAAINNICRCGTFQQVREAIHWPPRPPREGADHDSYAENHASFLPHQQRAVGGGLAVGPAPASLRSRRGAGSRRVTRNHRLGGDPPGQHHRHPRGPRRNGPGQLTGLAQLVAESSTATGTRSRSSTRRPAKARRETRLGRVLHRRQPRHPPVERIRAQGRAPRA